MEAFNQNSLMQLFNRDKRLVLILYFFIGLVFLVDNYQQWTVCFLLEMSASLLEILKNYQKIHNLSFSSGIERNV